ncbi:MAG: sugar phosphate isomerase/epimerase family protein [Planctomycetia bacterium]|nr:sugar phosphate isomerase/epimerase family protein [Planctomycetia bacterium]
MTRAFFLGYNTNGLAHHAFPDACQILSEEGYEGIAITLDHDLLERVDDFRLTFKISPEELAKITAGYGLKTVVETGARFLLDPREKHTPTLFDKNASRVKLRQEYYYRAVDLAAEMKSTCVSLWSGTVPADYLKPKGTASADHLKQAETQHQNLLREEFLKCFCEALLPVMEYAETRHVKIALEPEPGMLVEKTSDYADLCAILAEIDAHAAQNLWLTLDVGHLYCMNEPIYQTIIAYSHRLINIHLDDARRNVHEHLRLGNGEISFKEILHAITDAKFSGGVCVELSRHSHNAPETVRNTRNFIRKEWKI